MVSPVDNVGRGEQGYTEAFSFRVSLVLGIKSFAGSGLALQVKDMGIPLLRKVAIKPYAPCNI